MYWSLAILRHNYLALDVEATYSFSENWRADASLNYVRGMRTNSANNDADLYRIAPLNGRAQLTYNRSGWMGAIEGVFYADQGDVIGYINGIGNEQKTKGYMLLNLRSQYAPYKGVTLGVGIKNVLDSKHYDHLGGYRLHNLANGRIASQGRTCLCNLGLSLVVVAGKRCD